MTSRSTGGRHRAPRSAIRSAPRPPAPLAVGDTLPTSRARHRAARRFPGLALPTAAAAALVLTATGATASDNSPVALDLTGSQAAQQQDADRRSQANQAVEMRQLQEQRANAAANRLEQSRRVARAKERATLVEARAAKAKADAKAEAEAQAREQWVEPVAGCTRSSPYGARWGKLHAGNDFACAMGTPIKAMSSGTVVFAGDMGGYGRKVEIRYWDGTVSYFGHMDSFAAAVGDAVMPGEVVGYSGNTGRSTGPHLHLEIHPSGGVAIDPVPWLQERQLFTTLLGSPPG